MAVSDYSYRHQVRNRKKLDSISISKMSSKYAKVHGAALSWGVLANSALDQLSAFS